MLVLSYGSSGIVAMVTSVTILAPLLFYSSSSIFCFTFSRNSSSLTSSFGGCWKKFISVGLTSLMTGDAPGAFSDETNEIGLCACT